MDRPNILLIMADQFRFDYMGCAGAAFVRTPNLDRLAAHGVRFTRCATNSPLCAPARISLATGLDPVRLGALDNESFLHPDLATYYQRLRDHGYRVGCVGKLDLAKPDQYNGRHGDRPCLFRWGFTHPEEVEGKEHSLGKPAPMGPYGFWLAEQGLYDAYYRERRSHKSGGRSLYTPSDLPAETFLDVYQGRRAVEWLRRVPEDFPWHLFVSFSGPHMPHDPPREYFDRYLGAAMPPAVPRPAAGLPQRWARRPATLGNDAGLVAEMRRAYCAYIELIDEWIGRLLDTLEERGVADHTCIVFSADHGEMLGDLGFHGKSLPYEASARVPLLAAGPGVAEGKVCDALVELSDVNPTICQLAGLPEARELDARSFHACLADPAQPHRDELVSTLRHWHAIRTERYKYVEHHSDERELYDLESDPHEEHNLLAEPDDVAKATAANLHKRLLKRQCVSPHGRPRAER